MVLLIAVNSNTLNAGKDWTDKLLWGWITETRPSMQVSSDGPGYPGISELSQKAGMRLVNIWDTVNIYYMYMRGKSI